MSFEVSNYNHKIVQDIGKQTYKSHLKNGAPLAKGKKNLATEEKSWVLKKLDAYVPNSATVGQTVGQTVNSIYGESLTSMVITQGTAFWTGYSGRVLELAALGSQFIFGPYVRPAVSALCLLAATTAVSYGNRLIRGSSESKKKLEKLPEINQLSDYVDLNDDKELCFADGTKLTERSLKSLSMHYAVYSICQQILNVKSVNDIIIPYIRVRDDSKIVLDDGHVCTEKEAEILFEAYDDLRDLNAGNESINIKAAITLLAEHRKPITIQTFNLSNTSDHPLSSEMEQRIVEMDDETIGFEDDNKIIHQISREKAEKFRTAINEKPLELIEPGKTSEKIDDFLSDWLFV